MILSSASLMLLLTVMLLLVVGFLVGSIWVARRTDLPAVTRRHFLRFAPLYLVAGPPAVTYFGVCGSLSIVTIICFGLVQGDLLGHSLARSEQWGELGLLEWLRASEYVCSFVGAFGFVWLIRWVGLPRFWHAILAVSLGVSAAYRTARLDPTDGLVSGPAIRMSPQWIDVLPVLLGLAACALVQKSAASSL